MSHLVGELFPAQKATIVSRGQALGYTLNMPAEDRYLHTREEFVDLMMVFLAGRAAEQIVFGRITNGAANDLERVTQIARSMVFEYGMSEVAPSRTMRADNYALSEETKRLRDSEQARLTDYAYEEAQRLLHEAPRAARPRRGGAAREGDARPLGARGAACRRNAGVALVRDGRHGARASACATNTLPRVDERARAYYEHGNELGRLGWLELARTKELLTRLLPAAPALVLDVGGGPGVYAEWLAGLGYQVHLVDPIALHVEEALARSDSARVTAALGDARALSEADGSVDAVLLLGPLYHLTERGARLSALREAHRVLKSGGTLAAAAISRFASLLDGIAYRRMSDPAFVAIVDRDLCDGQHRNPDDVPGWFTTAYFHRPDELADEIADAGFDVDAVYGVEGATAWLSVPSDQLEQAERESLVAAARAIEREPTLIGGSPHLLGIARKRSE